MTDPRRALLAAALLLLVTSPAPAQRPSPLIYDDPEYVWLDNRDPDSPRPSPNALAGLQIGSTRVMVAYGSPGVKGRKIFGGLVPWDALWRTGANEATTITASGDLLVEGRRLAAGTYSLFTIPRPDTWTFLFNKVHNQWGAYSYPADQEALRVDVAAAAGEPVENLTFGFERIAPDGATASLVLSWDRTRVRLALAEAE